jgi:hypothetical protein
MIGITRLSNLIDADMPSVINRNLGFMKALKTLSDDMSSSLYEFNYIEDDEEAEDGNT